MYKMGSNFILGVVSPLLADSTAALKNRRISFRLHFSIKSSGGAIFFLHATNVVVFAFCMGAEKVQENFVLVITHRINQEEGIGY